VRAAGHGCRLHREHTIGANIVDYAYELRRMNPTASLTASGEHSPVVDAFLVVVEEAENLSL
jgi:hypothetical protein